MAHETAGRTRFPQAYWVALLLVAAGVSLAVGVANMRTSDRLIAEGLATTARVSGKHAERSRSWIHRYIDIEYETAEGQRISARDGVAQALYDRRRVGDTITVRYLAAEPDVHSLGRTARRDTFMLWIAGLWLVLAGVYSLFGS